MLLTHFHTFSDPLPLEREVLNGTKLELSAGWMSILNWLMDGMMYLNRLVLLFSNTNQNKLGSSLSGSTAMKQVLSFVEWLIQGLRRM